MKLIEVDPKGIPPNPDLIVKCTAFRTMELSVIETRLKDFPQYEGGVFCRQNLKVYLYNEKK